MVLFVDFLHELKLPSFCHVRLGTNIGKALKKEREWRLLLALGGGGGGGEDGLLRGTVGRARG